MNNKSINIKVKKDQVNQSNNSEIQKDIIHGVDSGNRVLDTILTKKNILCLEKKIHFTFVIDGKQVNFLDEIDLFFIFENALNNAIECVSKINEEDKRLINMAVFLKNEFIIIRFENYFEEYLNLKNDLPIINKIIKEKNIYGFKGIKKRIEKYGGHMHIKTDNNWFSLYILIPKHDLLNK